MSSSSRAVDYSRIRHRIKVPRLGSNTTRSRRDAARYIDLGYQVTDDYDRDLTIETLPDGTRRVVIGEDPLATYSERINRAADAGAGPSRPANLPERELTDYEARRRHVTEECNIPNCDHPVHFGGNEYGTLTFEPVEPKSVKDDLKKKDRKDGEDGAGGGGSVSGGAGENKA